MGRHLAGSERLRGTLTRVTVHEWTVAGALIETEEGILLVRNIRHGGHEDWSTPGGVIDAEDASILDGLAREVTEETGLRVSKWSGPLYEVHTHAVDMGWHMRCEVHLAVAFEGDLVIADPDGIVVEAAFVPPDKLEERLATGYPWVREPLAEWLLHRWEPGRGRGFHYEVRGARLAEMRVVRRF